MVRVLNASNASSFRDYNNTLFRVLGRITKTTMAPITTTDTTTSKNVAKPGIQEGNIFGAAWLCCRN